MSVGRYHSWVRTHLPELVDVLPHEAEMWEHRETDLSQSAFHSLRINGLIDDVEAGPPTKWRTMPSTADKIREYVERYGVEFGGDDPLVTLSESDENAH